MPEDFDPNGLDIEAQLRRYADHVEGRVADVSSPTRGTGRERRWPIYLVVAAALLLVVGLASVLLGDDDEGTDPVADPDVVTEQDDEPDSEPEDRDEPDEDAETVEVDPTPVYDLAFPDAPIAARVGAVVVGSETHVLVWGGTGESGERLNDGAILDLAAEDWAVVTDSPFDGPPVDSQDLDWSVAFSDVLGEFVIGGDLQVATLDPSTALWTELPSPEGPVDNLIVDDLLVVEWAGGIRTADLRTGEFAWTDPFFVIQADSALSTADVEWSIRGDEMVAVARRSAEGLAVVTYSPSDGSSHVVDTYDWQDVAAGQAATRAFDATLVSGGELVVVHEGGAVVTWSPDFSARSELPIRTSVDPRGFAGMRIDSAGAEALVRLPGSTIYVLGDGARATLSNEFIDRSAVSAGPNGPTMWSFGSTTPGRPGTDLDGSEIFPQGGDPLPLLVGPVLFMPTAGDEFVSWNVADFGEVVVLKTQAAGACAASFLWGEIATSGPGLSRGFGEGVLGIACELGGEEALLDRFVESASFAERREGPVTVPPVQGLFADTGMQTLRDAGFEVVIQFEQVEAGSQEVGRVIAQSPAAFELGDPSSPVLITVGEAAWQPITDRQARRVVDGFLTALAAAEWEIAVAYMDNGAAVPQSLLDIGMPEESRDWSMWIADWCEDALCGAAYEIGEIVRDGPVVEVHVAFESSSGTVTETVRLSWFEGQITVDWMPPAGVAGRRALTTAERLFGAADDHGEFIAAWANHQEIQRLGSIEHGVNFQHRMGGSRGAAGTFLLVGDEPIVQTSTSGERIEVSAGAFAGSADVDGPVVFTYDYSAEELGVVALGSGIPVPDVVRDTSDREASATYVSVGNESIVFSVGAEEASWLEVYDRDGYAATGDATAVLNGVGPLTYGTIAPDDSSIVALTGPEFAPARSVWHLTFDGATAEWALPEAESFAGGLDFDGRWVIAPLESGRVFVVDTQFVAARVVDVYAEVWFD